MRVAALYDIHGNLPALDAVLADVRSARVDRIVVGGDVLPGPMPRETLDRLVSLDVPVDYLYGNGEVAALEYLSGRVPSALPEAYRTTNAWCAEAIRSTYGDAVARWPKTLRLRVDGIGDVVFCHGTPRDENEIFTVRTSGDTLRPIFDPLNAALVVCGHTHIPFDRMVGRTRVVNAGSVGMPFGSAGADWLIVGPDVRPRRTDYDRARAAERIRATAYPDAERFAATFVLNPPSAETMLDVFSGGELRGGSDRSPRAGG